MMNLNLIRIWTTTIFLLQNFKKCIVDTFFFIKNRNICLFKPPQNTFRLHEAFSPTKALQNFKFFPFLRDNLGCLNSDPSRIPDPPQRI